jgi:uncharacterized protein (UPF0333 family)
MFRQSSRGQATLSFVLLIGGIILEIAVAGSFVTYFLSSSGLNERLSARALSAAEAGIRDVQIKIARNKAFSMATSTIVVGSDLAVVQLSSDATNPDSYVYTITSVGIASSAQRKIVAVLVVNKITGLVQLQSMSEQSVQ